LFSGYFVKPVSSDVKLPNRLDMCSEEEWAGNEEGKN